MSRIRYVGYAVLILGLPLSAFFLARFLTGLVIGDATYLHSGPNPTDAVFSCNRLIGTSTVFYAIVSSITLGVVLVSAVVTLTQVRAVRDQREASVHLEISKQYSTREMMNAVKAIHERHRQGIDPHLYLRSRTNDHRRRIVANFWHTIGALHTRGLIRSDTIRAKYHVAPLSTWKALRDLEIATLYWIKKQDSSGATPKELARIRAEAIAEVDECPAARFARMWDRKYGPQKRGFLCNLRRMFWSMYYT
jgi:hypothetical protein